jgi:ABC-type transporter Mla subunit MlaD
MSIIRRQQAQAAKDSAERGFNFDRVKLELKRASLPFVLLVLLWVGGILAASDILRNLAGTKPWRTYVHYQAYWSNLQGVVPGRVPVQVAGVDAGAITKVHLVGGRAVMDLSLEKKYAPLYKNAVLQLRPFTPLDNLYLDITSRGTPSAGTLPKGYILPATQTIFPVQISRVMDIFDTNTRAHLSNLIDELGSGLKDHGYQLRQTFVQLAPFMAAARNVAVAVNQRHQDLAKLVHYFGGIMQVLALRDRQLQGFVSSANGTLASLASHNQPFNTMLGQLPSLLNSMQTSFGALQNTENHLDPALQSLEPVASAMPGGLQALKNFSTEAAPAVRALTPASASLLPFAQALQPATGQVQQAVSLFTPQAAQIDRSTALADTGACKSLIANFLENVMSITKFGDTGPQKGSPGNGNYTATARADVQIGFNEGSMTPNIGYTVHKPCYLPGGYGGP